MALRAGGKSKGYPFSYPRCPSSLGKPILHIQFFRIDFVYIPCEIRDQVATPPAIPIIVVFPGTFCDVFVTLSWYFRVKRRIR